MGSDQKKSVKLTSCFWLSDRQMSVEQFVRFIDDLNYTGPKVEDWQGYSRECSPTGRHPIQTVSWNDAVAYCNWLSHREGLVPYYQVEDWEPVKGANGFRLPTEAEWEYVCRAGTTTEYCFGAEEDLLGEYAVSGTSTTEICGSLLPNAWGLFDMHGNVWEWCGDRFGDYDGNEAIDPIGPNEGTSRVVRGGSFLNLASLARSASRDFDRPGRRSSILGFRVARTFTP
jgi:formylglycine-generating enzyme required for sulfatase activity